jgi:glycosyltransferase involved in cell wall biosynthesis
MVKKKKAIIAFLGNINFDTRCFNLCNSLKEKNIEVQVISFDWLTPKFSSQSGEISIYKLDKSKSSFWYYIKFLYILTKKTIFSKADYYFAEDVYTLPIMTIFSKIYNGKLFYDSRELYGHLAGLADKRKIQAVLAFIENLFIRHTDHVLVTGEMDADYLSKQYIPINIILLRNLPSYKKEFKKIDLRERYNLPVRCNIIIYQGVILKGRGLLLIMRALKKIENYSLLIMGDGDYQKELIDFVDLNQLSQKVIFGGKVTQEELLNFTNSADIGLALIEDISLSYYYALPNKLFEYIMAEIPVMVSNLPQMQNVVEKYNVGVVVNPNNIEEIESGLKQLIDKYDYFKANCIKAKEELSWEKEVQTLLRNL